MEEIKATISFHMGSKHNEKHDNRELFVPYVLTELSKNNVYYEKNMSREEAFEYLFGDFVREYNSKQSRSDRKIENYLQKLLDAEERQNQIVQKKRSEGCSYKEIAMFKKSKHPSMQFIVSIGNMQENPELIAKSGNDAHRARAVLEEYMKGFQDRNPNAFLYNAALHGDETSVWHGHFTIIWYADNCPKGMRRQVSQKRALETMGFVSDTEKGEDGKLHLAIEKWQNREREFLRQTCIKHGIIPVVGSGSREHLDREHYIIKKKHEENKKRECEIKEEYNSLISDVNEQAGQVLIQKEKIDKQIEHIKDFLENTDCGRQYAVFSKIEDIQNKSEEYVKIEEEQKQMLSLLWDEYKKENEAYWELYRSKKKDYYELIQYAREGKEYNEKLLKQYLWDFSNRSENLLMKLFSLITVISLILRKRHMENELEKVKKEYSSFKENARSVLQVSKSTSMALKTKKLDCIDTAMNNWHLAIKGINQSLNAVQNEIEQKNYER